MPSTHANDISCQPWLPVWPTEFLHDRNYNREEENISYVEWAKSNKGTAHIDIGSTVEESEDEEEDDDPEGTNADQGDYEDIIEDSNMKTFMAKKGAIHQFLSCDEDPIDEVINFCECSNDNNDKQVALIDDRNNVGDRRPYLGPLKAQELLDELKRPRFNASGNVFDDETLLDAYRRIIFVSGLSSRAIEVMATTASRTQAPALRDMFCKHLTSQASMGVYIPTQGCQLFTLHFNIPYYALRSHKKLITDNRMGPGHIPLRKSWELHSLSQASHHGLSKDQVDCVYEAHFSFTVTGLDHKMWTAYAFVDSYFNELDSVQAYDEMGGPSGGIMDPLTMGNLDAQRPIWNPRLYFTRVVEIRLRQIVVEWNRILKPIEKDIEQSRFRDDYKINPTDDPRTQQIERQRIRVWASRKMHELRKLKPAIFDTIRAFKEFKKGDIEYFRDDEAPSSLGRHLENISKSSSALESAGQKVIDMMEELRQDYPQGVSQEHFLTLQECIELRQDVPGSQNQLHAQLSFETNESQAFQQRSASHIQMLTYVTIVFIPVVVSTSIFSMQGVLPFTPTLAHFGFVLVILTVIVVITLAALFHWSCLEPIPQAFLTAVRELFNAILVLIPGGLRHSRVMAAKAIYRAEAIRRTIFFRGQRRYADAEQGLEMEVHDS